MGASAQLSTSELAVEPGRNASTKLTVRNGGSVVDRFSFEAVGSAARWVSFSPDTLSLFPQASGEVTVTFAPPRDPTVTAGATPFGVRVLSSEDPAESVVEEGTIEVGTFSDVSADVLPHVTRGRRWARAQMAIDNRSNCPYVAELQGKDPSSALTIGLNPVSVEVAPGAASFVKIRLKPKKTFWRGPSKSLPYAVVLSTQPLPGAPPAPSTPAVGVPLVGPHRAEIVTDGSMLQESLIASWVFKVLAALVALAVLLTILWFALLKPQIKSTAQNVVRSQLQAAGVTPKGGTGTNSGTSGGTGGSNGGTGTSNVTTGVAPGGTGTSGAGGTAAAGAPVNGTGTAHGNGSTPVFTVPGGKELEITDLLVENSSGSSGTLFLERNGTVLMQWALADFRDLDYHWIVPTILGAGTTLQMVVSGCPTVCTPGIYYAGNLVRT